MKSSTLLLASTTCRHDVCSYSVLSLSNLLSCARGPANLEKPISVYCQRLGLKCRWQGPKYKVPPNVWNKSKKSGSEQVETVGCRDEHAEIRCHVMEKENIKGK